MNLQGRAPVTALVLTFNEELNLPACLDSLRGWVDRIVVVDSGSTDGTVRIAEAHGAYVLRHPFQTHSTQWRWAIENLPEGASDWILGLDADQRVTAELAAEIRQTLGTARGTPDGVAGYYIKRRQIFRGRWIRHGGYYPKYLLKLFRRDGISFDENELVDHHFYVRGRTQLLKHDLIEANRKEDDLAFWIDKHCRYARLMAQQEFLGRADHGVAGAGVRPSLLGSPNQSSLWRRRVWMHMPLFARPWLYFVYRYFVRLGFLDGREGLVFHFVQACWFRFMVDTYLDELRRGRGGVMTMTRDSVFDSPHSQDPASILTGTVVWLTGLSCAGKTTIAEALKAELLAKGAKVELLDGDAVRKSLCRDLGFTKEDGNENVRRLSAVASLLARHDVVVLVAAISPFRESREEARSICGRFIEVYVNSPLCVCDDLYEPPLNPAVECRTDQESVSESVAKVMRAVEEAHAVAEKPLLRTLHMKPNSLHQ